MRASPGGCLTSWPRSWLRRPRVGLVVTEPMLADCGLWLDRSLGPPPKLRRTAQLGGRFIEGGSGEGLGLGWRRYRERVLLAFELMEVQRMQNLIHNRRLILGAVLAILVVAVIVLLAVYSGGGHGGGGGY